MTGRRPVGSGAPGGVVVPGGAVGSGGAPLVLARVLSVLAAGLLAAACATGSVSAGSVSAGSVSAGSGSAGSPPAGAGPAPAATAPPAPGPATDPGPALIDAAERGDAGAVQALLAGGAPVDARDGRGATALVRAAYRNHVEVAAQLVAAGADVNLADDTRQSAFLIATSEVGDDPRLLELTVRAGADLNAKDSYDGTGLIRAAERAHVTIVERLLRAGIDRDHINRLGYTALHEAVVFGEGGPADQATVSALVAGGVALDIPDHTGTTALAHAERRGQREVAAILRAAGATG